MRILTPFSTLIGMFVSQVFAAQSNTITCAPGPEKLQDIIQTLITLSVPLAFVALTVIFFWGGIKFLISSGDPKSLAAARQTMLWGILGIAFLGLSIIILNLIQQFTGADVTHFSIGFPGLSNGNCP